MNIGIIGSGHVGGTLGRRWSKAGHSVTYSSRHPHSDEMKKLVSESGSGTRAGTVPEAVASADVLLLATPWPATQEILAGAGDLSGKILIDATNPLLPRLEGLDCGTFTSGAERVAGWAPGARLVKAFNTVGANIMANPSFDCGLPVMFYCGDDSAAKALVRQLISEVGFDAEDAGPLTQARVLEPFALLWISLALQYGHGMGIAFKFLKK